MITTHLTDTPCPKCGAPTISDSQGRWIMCMMFDDIRTTPLVLKPGSPMPKFCDYGEWLPGGKEAEDKDREDLEATFGDEVDREFAIQWRKEGYSLALIASYFSDFYGREVTKGTIALWELEEIMP